MFLQVKRRKAVASRVRENRIVFIENEQFGRCKNRFAAAKIGKRSANVSAKS